MQSAQEPKLKQYCPICKKEVEVEIKGKGVMIDGQLHYQYEQIDQAGHSVPIQKK